MQRVFAAMVLLSASARADELKPFQKEDEKKAGTHDTKPRNVSLSKGLLTYQMHKGDKAIADDTRTVLEEALKAGSR